jgi:hypothetical protein
MEICLSHNKTLIGTITDKAQASYGKPLPDKFIDYDDGPWNDWEQHWLATARQWRDELQAEGLAETVEALNRTIAFFEKVGGGD